MCFPGIWLSASKSKASSEEAFRRWLPVEDYFQTSHELVIPADLIAIK
jgi:hypothetical protein